MAIPGRLNLAILVAASLVATALLYAASHAGHWGWVVLFALAFSFVGNTLFSLLHESVHRTFHPNPAVNDWAGRFAGAWFPTGLSIQRAFHLNHHRNNRGPLEQFDYLRDDDIGWLKRAQWYAILTGVYWLVAVLGVLVYLAFPFLLRLRTLRKRGEPVAEQTSARAYLEVLDDLPPMAARAEILFAFLFQIALFYLLDLSLIGWSLCYGAFAFQWSGLQYADHAYSPLDPRDGAWNLWVPRWWRLAFLNYHLHLAHHRDPNAPWIALPKLVQPEEPQPSYFRMWLSMWSGPRAHPDAQPSSSPHPQHFRHVAEGDKPDIGACALLVLAFLVVFAIFYGGPSSLLPYLPYRVRVDFPFEAHIPFVPEASVVYLSMDLLLGLSPFILYRWRALFPFFVALTVETVIAAAFFLLVPVETQFPPRVATGPFAWFFHAADATNLNGNFLPSLHVTYAFTAAWAYAPRFSTWVRWGLFGWASAIAVSTMLIHEHHVLDVLAGLALVVVVMRTAYRWAQRKSVLDAVAIEARCVVEMLTFARRHPRYLLIALGLYWASFPHFFRRRVLRTGFVFLQAIDDILDGDRAATGEPEDEVHALMALVERPGAGDTPEEPLARLVHIGRAFREDMERVHNRESPADAWSWVTALVKVMMGDRHRVRDGTVLAGRDLSNQLRATFSLSIDLMLWAGGSPIRSDQCPALIELLGWCSTVRDLEEDLNKGLVNLPREVLEEDNARPFLEQDPVKGWLADERTRAASLYEEAKQELSALHDLPGAQVLSRFHRSIRKYLRP